MNLSVSRKIKIGSAVSLVVVLAAGIVALRNADEIKANAALVAHTFQVLQQLQNLANGLSQAESAERAYLITSEDSYQEAVQAAVATITPGLRSLRTLTGDNPSQQRRLDSLEPVISRRLDTLRKKLDLLQANQGKMTPQIQRLFQDGTRLMAEARQLIVAMQAEEQELLAGRQAQAKAAFATAARRVVLWTLVAFLLVGLTSSLVTRSVTSPLRLLSEGAAKIGAGEYGFRVAVRSKDELGRLATLFNEMAEQVQRRQMTLTEQDWVKTSLAKFSRLFQGQRDLSIFCRTILNELAALVGAQHAVFYVRDPAAEPAALKLEACYAFDRPKPRIQPGEGLIGQCLLDRRRVLLRDVPADYLQINSALGRGRPANLLVLPAVFEAEVKAVIELASFQPFSEIQLTLLNQLAESLGIVLTTVETGMRTEELLQQARSLSESLRGQQRELSEKNRELEDQADQLKKSEQLLHDQQEELKQANEELEQTNEELRQANEEMEEKANLLAQQKQEVERANRELELARAALEDQARQLARTSKYKSEFLANMSHELRTPLNSLLILSRLLAENTEKNLTDKQVQHAKTIYSSGNDLLELINDILDLSKIESGTAEVEVRELQFPELARFVEDTFRHVAESRNLDFQVRLDPQLPRTLSTDGRRLEQVIKNLLSNAFKFTEKGSVELKIGVAAQGWDARGRWLNAAEKVIAFTVTDTGIGIPPEKQQLIFEAFQQADAGTARKYGGTGLGLSISRELARLLRGSLQVESVLGQGSAFTLYLPATFPAGQWAELKRTGPRSDDAIRPAPAAPAREETGAVASMETEEDFVEDDRAGLRPDDCVLLIVEDDRNFARVLVEFAREKKFKAVVARTAAQGIALARELQPAAITLDLLLPDNDGWVVLDRLKHDPKMRHIPVHLISVEEQRERGLRLGAVSYLQKPVTKEALEGALNQTIEFINRPVKNLLIVEDDPAQRRSLVELVGNGDVRTTAVGTAAEALAALKNHPFDCLVLDLVLPDMTGAELIRQIHKSCGHHSPPIVVYTGKELSRQEETELRMISESIIIKDARSPERLLDETALFLHRVQAKLPESKRRMIEQVQRHDSILSGRKVLVVDDDVRNIFAITSALESHQMQVHYAESGQAALDLLQNHPDIEVVLMDVMMPEMDGFEAIRRIRQMDHFKKLPILSVTAKAMKGDRERCLQAGASDYITKPVDVDQLRSLLRVWLYQ